MKERERGRKKKVYFKYNEKIYEPNQQEREEDENEDE